MGAKITALEREIRKHHEVVQVAKTQKVSIENPDF